MDVDTLIKSIKSRDESLQTKFYKKCVKKLESYKIESGNMINKIPDDRYILESIRIFLLQSEHFIYIIDRTILQMAKDNKSVSYREYDDPKLSEKAINNLLHQIYAMEENNIKYMCRETPYKIEHPCLVLSKENIYEKNDKCICILDENKYSVINLMLGVESLDLLEHQNLERFCSYIVSEKSDIKKSTNMFGKFYKFYNKLDLQTKERLILFSGSILHSLGTTYTSDIDIIYYGEGESKDKIAELVNTFRNINYCDYYVIYGKKILARKPSGEYQYKWLLEKWPGLVGKDNIVELMADPKYRFHFLGIKMVGVKMIIERLLSRASPSAFVDLIMLKKINKYKSSPCFPNLSLRQGKITVYNHKQKNKALKTVKKYFKEWHGVSTSVNSLKREIIECNEKPHNIYSKEKEKFQYSTEITRYHNMFSKSYIDKYFKKTNLLDVGAGPLRQVYFYKKIGINKLVAIEPSDYSIKEGLESIKKRNIVLDVNVINGYGDESWEDNDKYSDVIKNKPYKSILFKFTIHYMLKNIDTVIQNIKSVDKDNTVIMITCLDGNKIEEKLKENNGRYEIIIGDEPLYGIYDMENVENGLKQIMIYFRGVYGVESGSIEYIVDIDWLISKFESIGYGVLENKSFLETSQPHLIKIRDKLNETQKKVSELHKILIFSKNQKNTIQEGGDKYYDYQNDYHNDYYDLYMKYKSKYISAKYNNI